MAPSRRDALAGHIKVSALVRHDTVNAEASTIHAEARRCSDGHGIADILDAASFTTGRPSHVRLITTTTNAIDYMSEHA